ncbi:MAG TPA: LysM peptidoglycan-binding domain-containing protein [Verrucomicrobiae bacterium]|nr:LysM peptidoglycan-binding domain-containing protein [Verrucomicrobiae bacterium]
MNNANPLIPQGSLLEQKDKGKPHLRVALFIVAVHLVFLGGLLIQGCKKEEEPPGSQVAATNDLAALPPLDRDSPYSTNLSASPPALDPGLTSPPPITTNLIGQNPLPTAVLDPNPPPAGREYVVIKGDSFYSIGKKFGVSANAIARANPGIDPTRLKVGDKVQIPPASSATASVAQATAGSGGADVYVVKSGDTLSKIAQANKTTVNEIKALNGLKTDRINIGDKLKLPAARPASAAGSTVPPPANPVGNP